MQKSLRSPLEVAVVSISYEELLGEDVTLPSRVHQAFGASGLGIVTISDVPGLPELRRHLLRLGDSFADLPEDVKGRYADPLGGQAVVGWSRGIEALEDGRPDMHKGSFYANPLHDQVTTDAVLLKTFPSYTTPNIWPEKELPELRVAFRELGQLILRVGLLVAQQCDRLVRAHNLQIREDKLTRVLRESPNPKGRLLHYYPPTNETLESPWCAQHTDHGSLTGLLSALYTENGEEVVCPDPEAGLYIRGRDGTAVKAPIPASHIAFQMGEAMQVHSGGLLQATPHFVKAATGPLAAGVARNTFAVFMQPKWDEAMEAPPGANPSAVGIGQWKAGMTFGEFSELTIQKYNAHKSS